MFFFCSGFSACVYVWSFVSFSLASFNCFSIYYLYSKNSVVIELKRCLHLLDFVIKNICKSGVINQAGEMAARFMDFRVFECYRRFEWNRSVLGRWCCCSHFVLKQKNTFTRMDSRAFRSSSNSCTQIVLRLTHKNLEHFNCWANIIMGVNADNKR